jgi:hypothetical protein
LRAILERCGEEKNVRMRTMAVIANRAKNFIDTPLPVQAQAE